MDINELNLYSCKTYFHRAWKSGHIRCVNLGQCHLQYQLRLLETEIIRDRETATEFLSGVQAKIAIRILGKNTGVSKVLKGRMFAWQEMKT